MIGSGSTAKTKSWPRIKVLNVRYTFADFLANTDTPVNILIRDVDGHAVYKLECHNGNYDDMSEINFSGDFQCALFAINNGQRTSWNLLASDSKAEQSSDWLNRGRMTANQLRGDCAAYPEYGAARNFRLRGMLITFRFDNLKWSTASGKSLPRLAGMTFAVKAVPDPSAETSTAEPAIIAQPPNRCN